MHKKTSERVRQSMVSMLIMRPFSAISGFLSLIILSRLLSVTDYALYFLCWAIIEIFVLASNFGLINIAYRYISASESKSSIVLPQGPVLKLLLYRLITLLITSVMLSLFPEFVLTLSSSYGSINNYVQLVAVIIFFEGAARFLEVIFDSMLCQKEGQISLISRTLIRVAGYIYFYTKGQLVIGDVLLTEVIATVLGFLLGLFLLIRVIFNSKKHPHQEENPPLPNIKKLMIFALPAFAAQLMLLLYSPDALKIVLANSSKANELAIFGFCYSIIAMIQRYIPSMILGGLFKPLFVNASKKSNSIQTISDLLLIIVKLNWIVILPISVFIFVAGPELLILLSKGRYVDTALLLDIMSISLLAVSVRVTLSMVCVALETTWPTLFSTAFSALSLIVAIVISDKFGAIGAASAYCLGETVWSIFCLAYLKWVSRYQIRILTSIFVKLLLISSLLILFSTMVKLYVATDPLLLGIVASILFLVSCYFISLFSSVEKSWLTSIMPALNRVFK